MKRILILLCILEILDGAMTRWAITSGLVREWNSMIVPLADNWMFVALKVLGGLACALALWTLHGYFPRLALISANSVVAFYGVVLTWNVAVLLRP